MVTNLNISRTSAHPQQELRCGMWCELQQGNLRSADVRASSVGAPMFGTLERAVATTEPRSSVGIRPSLRFGGYDFAQGAKRHSFDSFGLPLAVSLPSGRARTEGHS